MTFWSEHRLHDHYYPPLYTAPLVVPPEIEHPMYRMATCGRYLSDILTCVLSKWEMSGSPSILVLRL